jgi:streptogramin lyase
MKQTFGFGLSNGKRYGAAAALGVMATALSLSGCAGNFGVPAAAGVVPGVGLTGAVHGGQQAIVGATIQLYAASSTGYGAVSTALLTVPVTSLAGGAFSITGDYTCPNASSLVYLTAVGGNTGSGTNANSALMAPLGACGNLSASTFISINEVTTVAGAYALSAFMSAPNSLGTSPANATGLTNAFATVNKLVDVSVGLSPGKGLAAGTAVPSSKLNTIADIIAGCVNSTGGLAGDGSNCGTLFANSTSSSGVAPTDTITAALNIAKYPGSNVSTLLGISAGISAPFQPTTVPADFVLAIKYAPISTFSTPSAAALDASGNVWVTNAGNNSVTVLNAVTSAPTILTQGTLNAPSAIAFDQNGNAWVTSKGSSKLSVFTPGGAGTLTSVTGLSAPTSIAIDGQNVLWITDSGSSGVTNVTVSGTTTQTFATVTATGGVSAPVAVAINPH